MQKGFSSIRMNLKGSAAFIMDQKGVRQVASRAKLIGVGGRFNDFGCGLEL